MKIIIGFISYNQSTNRYLPFFLPSLKKAVYELEDIDFEIISLDNSEDYFDNYTYIDNFRRESGLLDKFLLIKSDCNLGFARGFNLIINEAIERKADLFLAVNPDVVLEDDSINKLVCEFIKNKDNFNLVSSFSPKILKWNFENNQLTKNIDSLGIGLNRLHRFFDVGQGELDNNYEFDEKKEIFGVSGAAAFFNIRALVDVAYNNGKHLEFFDEMMFMYKEDIDLAYRLQLAGWKSYLVPGAKVYHDRNLSSKSLNIYSLIFKEGENKLRSQSFLNQLILILKFKKLRFSFKVWVPSSFRFVFLLFYGLLFERRQILKIFSLRKEIEKRRKALKNRNNIVSNIEKLMKNG
ncbi:hypothetical protein CVU82_02475 [Candidatus Falkowbacteria bacterium HGW-Falkowbacteria-1]|jgi:GT2 family glycosyltransferase|uniref:Glycosyltransferase 2-like domain-containing protein n=1 Tax=Candidatus Falkowbacteria bacterium HGW-Falkowbacteria-1 TaxID=2013768 RepID=A0A2N2E9T4_9BACT|nr:MAG: hypothetical protein CVU82_02475 [Candidatus Falkowbacteria bacterium HGW-Falkowbacteria-1]